MTPFSLSLLKSFSDQTEWKVPSNLYIELKWQNNEVIPPDRTFWALSIDIVFHYIGMICWWDVIFNKEYGYIGTCHNKRWFEVEKSTKGSQVEGNGMVRSVSKKETNLTSWSNVLWQFLVNRNWVTLDTYPRQSMDCQSNPIFSSWKNSFIRFRNKLLCQRCQQMTYQSIDDFYTTEKQNNFYFP